MIALLHGLYATWKRLFKTFLWAIFLLFLRKKALKIISLTLLGRVPDLSSGSTLVEAKKRHVAVLIVMNKLTGLDVLNG